MLNRWTIKIFNFVFGFWKPLDVDSCILHNYTSIGTDANECTSSSSQPSLLNQRGWLFTMYLQWHLATSSQFTSLDQYTIQTLATKVWLCNLTFFGCKLKLFNHLHSLYSNRANLIVNRAAERSVLMGTDRTWKRNKAIHRSNKGEQDLKRTVLSA